MEAALQLDQMPVAAPPACKAPRRPVSTPSLDDAPYILPLRPADPSGALYRPVATPPVAMPANWLLKSLLPQPDSLPPLLNLRKSSPLRPPDWRWLRAARLRSEGQEPGHHVDNAYQVTLLKFQNRLAACRDSNDWLRLRLSMPSLFEAWLVQHEGGPEMQAELKSRLLAREPLTVIAKKAAMQPKAVRWFERVFFCVRDRLEAPSYIIQQAIKLHEKGGGDPVYKVWLLLAYTLGPLVVDELVYDRSPANRPSSPEQVATALQADAFATLRRRALVALRLMSPVNAKEATRLVKLYAKLSALDQENKRQCPYVDITANINVAYDRLVRQLDLADGTKAVGNTHPVPTEHLGCVRSPWLLVSPLGT